MKPTAPKRRWPASDLSSNTDYKQFVPTHHSAAGKFNNKKSTPQGYKARPYEKKYERRDAPKNERPQYEQRNPNRDERSQFASRRADTNSFNNRRDAPQGYRARPYEKNYPRRGNDRGSDRPQYDRRNADREDRPQYDRRNADREERPQFARRRNAAGSFNNHRDAPQGGYKARPYEKKNEPRSNAGYDRPQYDRRSPNREEHSQAASRYTSKTGRLPSTPQHRTSTGFNNHSTAPQGYKARPYEKKYEPRTDRYERPQYEERGEVRPKFVPPHRRRVVPETTSDTVRLNKFIANSGICSRREADEYIINGEITVNGEVVTTLGTKILPSDEVKFHDRHLHGEKKRYLLLNKPKGYITTLDDPHAQHTVMELIQDACTERIYPVGRLDRNTTGVLLFTNDGELTKQLTHPAYNKKKIYHVFLDKNVSKDDLQKLVDGVMLEDGLAVADSVNYVDEQNDRSQVGIDIHSGRNRLVRRMFEALGYEVKRLDRVFFAGLTKKSLERGKWRMLTPKEVSILKMGAYD
jgi:23S rRNA pseudouridine2605 synthase